VCGSMVLALLTVGNSHGSLEHAAWTPLCHRTTSCTLKWGGTVSAASAMEIVTGSSL